MSLRYYRGNGCGNVEWLFLEDKAEVYIPEHTMRCLPGERIPGCHFQRSDAMAKRERQAETPWSDSATLWIEALVGRYAVLLTATSMRQIAELHNRSGSSQNALRLILVSLHWLLYWARGEAPQGLLKRPSPKTAN